MSSFDEEAHASDPDIAMSFTNEMTEVNATAGTVLFLPRGFWHEVTCRGVTWSGNLVIKGMTWAQAIGNAPVARLHRSPELRAYCDGLRYGGHEPTTMSERADDSSRFSDELRSMR